VANTPRGYPEIVTSAESGRPMFRGEKRIPLKVADRIFWYWQPGWWCSLTDPNDNEGQLVDDDNVVAERARREAEAIVAGEPFTPALIRAIRIRCSLSQREAGIVFGTGTKSFEKYERGLIRPSGPMRRLLILAMSDATFIKKRKAMLDKGRPDPKLVARTIKDARLGRTFGSVTGSRGSAHVMKRARPKASRIQAGRPGERTR
jgi:HTH-type transcriptional regulator / antitoxin MqsA